MFNFMKSKAPSPIQIIALSGKKYSGKDTVLDMLMMDFAPVAWNHASTSKYLIERLSEKASNALGRMVTIEEIRENKQSWREALQKLGDSLEAQEPAFVMKEILALRTRKIIVESVRRASEIEYLRSMGAFFVLVHASDEARLARGCKNIHDEHPSEHEAVDILRRDADYILDNSGSLDELKVEVQRLRKSMGQPYTMHLI